eukprot:1187069-Prorocentrum_minimum.AAC.2
MFFPARAQAVAVAISLRQELHPNLELILNELMFFLDVDPNTLEDIGYPEPFLARSSPRPYHISNLDVTSKYLVRAKREPKRNKQTLKPGPLLLRAKREPKRN